MATPQHGIFALGTRAHHHLQLDVVGGVDGEALEVFRPFADRRGGD